jgi:hypothetical protein
MLGAPTIMQSGVTRVLRDDDIVHIQEWMQWPGSGASAKNKIE